MQNHCLQKTSHFSVGGVGAKVESSQDAPRQQPNDSSLNENDVNNENNNHIEKPSNADGNKDNVAQVVQPSSQQQVSRPSDDMQVGQNPQPLQAPQNHRHLDDDPAENNADEARFESRNGNIVPVGVNEQFARPIPYERQAEQEQQQQLKRVLAPPDEPNKVEDKKEVAPNALSSKEPVVLAPLKPQAVAESIQLEDEQNNAVDFNDAD